MGNPTKDFSMLLNLISDESVQIRDNAIESVRIAINRFLNKKIGKDAYFLKIRIYPFQVLRENKQAQGAGADRISKGMSLSFGTPIGRAARMRKGGVLMSVLVDEKDVERAKPGMMRANPKLPCGVHVEVSTDVASIGTKPRKSKILEEKEVEKVETTAEGAATAEAGAAPADAKKGEAKKDSGKAEDKKAAGKPAGKK